MTTGVRLDRGLLPLAVAVLLGAIPVLLDTTIVSVGLNTIRTDLRAPGESVQWVTSSYLLSLALMTPLVGRAADRFGTRAVWLSALTAFGIGSLLCAVAWSLPSLIAFRVVQGMGGAFVLPLAQSILSQAAGPERIGRVSGLIAMPAQVAPILGPVLGGFLVSAVGWRWVFLVNLPVVVIGIFLASKAMASGEHDSRVPIDGVGLLLLPAGLVALIYGLSRADTLAGLAHPATLALLAAGAILLTSFIAYARKAAHPLVDLKLFAKRSFGAAAALIFLHGIAIYGPLYLLPLFYARTLETDPVTIGWLLAPQGFGALLALPLAGFLADRYGPRLVTIGGIVATVAGTLVFTQLSSDPPEIVLGLSLLVRGIGLGSVSLAVITSIYRDVPSPSMPNAATAVAMTQRVGATFGTTIMALLLAIQLNGGTPDKVAYSVAFTVGLILTATTLLLAVLLPARRQRQR